MLPDTQETADLVAFTEEILNGKLNFLCSARTDVPLIIALAVTPVKECSEIGINSGWSLGLSFDFNIEDNPCFIRFQRNDGLVTFESIIQQKSTNEFCE